ncbi:MAG: hypothetical protein FJY07_11690, partial [Bacteroidetes bacterium]|nr:hypothetical protein [Bacteroidota bacterium]
MKRLKLVFIFSCMAASFTSAQQEAVRLGFILMDAKSQSQPEIRKALEFLSFKTKYAVKTVLLEELRNTDILQDLNILWFHHNDSTFSLRDETAKNVITGFVEGGGKLFLTLEGFRLLNDLGIETVPVETRNKTAIDEGYGRQLGLHAYREHPVFEGMNGGAYILKPKNDTTVRIHGFFEGNVPEKGNVIAVDWDYIFLRENIKLAIEYQF